MEITIEKLLQIIGSLHVELQIAREALAKHEAKQAKDHPQQGPKLQPVS